MLENIASVHAVGAGGIGLSAALKWCLAKGKRVSGSDARASEMTADLARRGATMRVGHAASNVPPDAGLLLYSPAVLETNPERVRASELGIPQWSYPEFLGALSREYSTIAVCGTNGKSTTTAMLGLILEEAGYDPTVIVGSLVPSFPLGNLRVGRGRFLVVEACEYRAHLLHLRPEMIVVTNVEMDHPDYFRDLEHVRETFQTFLDGMRGRGLAVTNADDPQSRLLSVDRGVTFGVADGTYRAGDYPVRLRVPGKFNAMNALAATAAAMELGVPLETCRRALEAFSGIWRRFERVGTWRGAELISDYGHHPTAVRGTVEAARDLFPGRRVVVCFQPHQHSRTREFLDAFADALKTADVVVLPEIYGVEGRTDGDTISSRDLAARVPGARYTATLEEAESALAEIVREGDVVIIQGAGDVDGIARKLGQRE